MMIKVNKYFLIIISIFTMFSCYENTVMEQGKPTLISLSSNTVFLGDQLTIYGNNLGINPEKFSIFIDSTLILSNNKADIIKWNNSFITLNVTEKFKTGMLYLIINNDTTNKLNISYNNIPGLQVIQVLPVTSYKMGSNQGAADESPEHNVGLTNKLEVSIYEITQNLWKFVMGSNPSSIVGDSLPVVNVKWEDALEFCNKLSAMKNYPLCYKKDNSSNWSWVLDSGGYRLPTEAEWEFFSRAGTTSDFSGNGNLNDMGWYELNSGYNIHKVGLKSKNGFGLYDVHGNAREWCWDYYSDDYYKTTELNDPKGPLTSNTKLRVARGGSAIDAFKFVRVSNRSYKDTLISFTGLRIVRTIK